MHASIANLESKSLAPRTTPIDKLKILKSYDRHETERPEILEKKKRPVDAEEIGVEVGMTKHAQLVR